MTNVKKPILLCILDGWGIGDDGDKSNAIALAQLPNYQKILATYPHSQLETSGLDVGLPAGQIGNSEVGHMAMGAGRIIYQDLPRINNAIADGTLAKNEKLLQQIAKVKAVNGTMHLMGLLSDGGVHSHIDHMIFFANFLQQHNIAVATHIFLDGRDVAQKSAIDYIKKFQQQTNNAKIATIGGRYYAMDRDNNWDRIKLAYDAIVNAAAPKFSDAINIIEEAYAQNITDEFIKPVAAFDYQGMSANDGLLFCNFRADRARQISTALLDSTHNIANSGKPLKLQCAIAATEYSQHLNQFYEVIFPAIDVTESLPEILASKDLNQLRIAESEKYAHVTFFFSCGREREFNGEKRILVKSPAVATYDLKPEMSCQEVGKNLAAAIESNEFDFIVVNYANPDMVGHSGILSASIAACKAIDEQLALISSAILKRDGIMIITADHGNIECMADHEGRPHTAHTTNPVPFIIIGNEVSNLKPKNGRLSDIAPTILSLMKITQPKAMTGNSLV